MQARRHQGKYLAAAVIASIKSDLDTGRFANAEIARRYGVCVRTVERIASGQHHSVRPPAKVCRCGECGGPLTAEGGCLRCAAQAMQQRHTRVAVACSGCQQPSRDLVFLNASTAVCPNCQPHAGTPCRLRLAS